MTDTYSSVVNSAYGRKVAKALGLPRPERLRRHEVGDPLLAGPAVLAVLGPTASGTATDTAADTATETATETGAGAGSPALAAVRGLLQALQTPVIEAPRATAQAPAEGEKTALEAGEWLGEGRPAALVVDATAARSFGDLDELRQVCRAVLRRLDRSGRVLVLARSVDGLDPQAAGVQQALEGIVRSVGKELRAGATANLLVLDEAVADGPEGADAVVSPVEFLLSGRSAYVSGQPLRVSAAEVPAAFDPTYPLAGGVVVVTGAARGIGAAIARVMARDGADVVAVDMPSAGEGLARVANEIGGLALQLDITAPDAAARIAAAVASRTDEGLAAIVHNAGITRDKLLVNTDSARWASVIAVNVEAEIRLNEALLGIPAAAGGFADGARIVGVASTSGLAGNRGQANYAASKAGVVGYVRALAPVLREQGRGLTINAVAPGFIETEMTAKMPAATREVARRINSLAQGGRPVDVAEAIAFLCRPASSGVTGQVLRVCGQSQIGA